MSNIDINSLYGVPVKMEFEIGRATRDLSEVLQFKKGTVIRLESEKGVIPIYLNGELFGQGDAWKRDGDRYVAFNKVVKSREEQD